jgi:hypothetical protein
MMTMSPVPAMPTALFAQRASGKGRDPWLIRRFLHGLGLTMSDVAAMSVAVAISEVLGACEVDDEAHKRLLCARREAVDAAAQAAALERVAIIDLAEAAA